MNLVEWLKGLGLGQYEATLREHEIDADVLPDLTEADLEKIGLPLGARKRLMKGIAGLALKEASPSAGAPAPAPETSAGVRLQQMDLAERRPITVMFCDLVGSTALASRLDAEDWRSLVNAYLDEASAAVTGLGGHVLKRLGDGLMALFGYPSAQENDAERAVRAALAIQRALAAINVLNSAKSMPELLARVGLESGPVVVEAAGEVFGDAPNIAARVQAAADPGSVLVTRNVQLQVAGLFVVEDRGPSELKGLPEPVSLYRVVRASGGGRRSGARTLTPFVGRDEELSLLARRWESVPAGEGQLVLIVGEPGLGKSRLIEEFRARLAETRHTWVEWSASQLLQNTPLHPISEWGRLRFGADAPAEQRLADLEGTLRLIGLDPIEHTALLAPLVDIPLPPGREAAFAPEELRRRQLAALVTWVLAGARSQPVVLAFEDLQWADPTSLDLLRALAERGSQAPLFLIATSRPEFRPSWGMRSHHSAISLAPLKRAQVYRMVGELASRHALSEDVVEGVSERTGGVPLFIEEVTRLLLEQGVVGGVQAIPPTLRQSLAARLDRLGPAREVAQIGAVLGRNFSYALLRDVEAADEVAMQTSLERLTDADILFVEGVAPRSIYQFKHALIQDAAYESLLKSRRQALHRRTAEILTGQPERAATEPEVIAYHFTQAGLDDQAIEWWGKAGDHALRRSAFQEAIAHLGTAIAMTEKATADPATATDEVKDNTTRHERRVKLQTAYGQALMWSKGFGAEETKAAFRRAGELAARSETSTERYAVYYAQWIRSFACGDLNSARKTAELFLHEAEADGRGMEAGRARTSLGGTYLHQGELQMARSCLERVLADHAPEWDMDARRVFGADTRILATVYLALSMWLLGDLKCARGLIEQTIEEAQQSGHAATIIAAYNYKAILEVYRDDAVATLRAAGPLVEISREHNVAFFEAFGRILLTWARARHLDPAAATEDLRQALAGYLERGNRAAAPWCYGLMAELAGSVEDALASVNAGLALAQETGERWTEPLLFRSKGEILLHRDHANPAPAEEAFRTAIAIAQQQGSRSFALRASLSLAKLCQSTDRPADAHAVLAPALEGFAPTPEMPEIAEAQALLSRLA